MIAALILSIVAKGQVSLVTTTTDLASIFSEIGGDHVAVSSLIPSSADPHAVMPKASMLVKLKRCDAIASMGLGYEHSFLPALLQKVPSSKTKVGGIPHFLASEYIGEAMEVPEKLDRGLGADIHPLGNPHWNTDPSRMIRVAEAARDFLIQLRPEQELEFRKNWKNWDSDAKQRIAHWKNWLEPAIGQGLVSYHRSWIYFADFFGFRILGEVEPKPGISPSPRHLAHMAKLMQDADVKFLLMEPWYSESQLGNLVKITNANLLKVTSNPIAGESYLDWMENLVSRIAHSLNLVEPKQVK